MMKISGLGFLVFSVLAVLVNGCTSATVAPTNTASPPTFTISPPPPPTFTPTVTLTPTPTATPNATATEFANRSDLMYQEIQKYVDLGYLSVASGTYSELPDFEQSLAKLGSFQWSSFDDLTLSTFVLSAHFKWSSAKENTLLAGCGFVFADATKAVFLDDKTVTLLSWLVEVMEVPKSEGFHNVRFKNSDEADFTLIANNVLKKVFVLVNDEFNVEYDLSGYTSTTGYIGYAVASGTNTDYGTKCEITNARLWKIK